MRNQSAQSISFNPGTEISKFSYADEVHEIASKVIGKWHSELSETKIVYLFKDVETWTSSGKTVLARTYKVPEQWHFLSGYDILIVVNRMVWLELTPEQREALIDHELCHILKDVDQNGNPKYSLVGHDLEEFSAVVQRHGMWMNDIKSFMLAAQQLTIEVLEK